VLDFTCVKIEDVFPRLNAIIENCLKEKMNLLDQESFNAPMALAELNVKFIGRLKPTEMENYEPPTNRREFKVNWQKNKHD